MAHQQVEKPRCESCHHELFGNHAGYMICQYCLEHPASVENQAWVLRGIEAHEKIEEARRNLEEAQWVLEEAQERVKEADSKLNELERQFKVLLEGNEPATPTGVRRLDVQILQMTTDTSLYFTITESMKMEKLMRKWCAWTGTNYLNVRFLFNRMRVLPEDTAFVLQMQHGDVLQVFPGH